MMKKIDEQVRRTFAGIADVLIPEAEGMPAASAVGVQEAAYLDRILGLRPDLNDAFFRGIASAQDKDPRDAAEALATHDHDAFGAISLAASSGYYMSPQVRELIGYPGQTARPFDEHEQQEYMTNGMLQRVINRGPIYRESPQG